MAPTRLETHTHPIGDFLKRTTLGPVQSYQSLLFWPLISGAGGDPAAALDYITLDEGFASGAVKVDEVSQDGSVPHVRVTNTGAHSVLFLFGEEIRGAKQNRVANASFLVPPKSKLVIDVSCVEAGRWGRRGAAGFQSSKSVLSSALRQGMAHRVASARAVGDAFNAGQSEVWSGIGQRLERSGTASPSQAYSDYAKKRAAQTDELLKSFRPLQGQVGIVASIDGAIRGLEAIGRPDVFEQHFEGLLRSYAIDAVEAPVKGGARSRRRSLGKVGFDTPESFLEALAQSAVVSGPSLGLGQDLRVKDPRLTGCALAHGDLVHLTAFPA